MEIPVMSLLIGTSSWIPLSHLIWTILDLFLFTSKPNTCVLFAAMSFRLINNSFASKTWLALSLLGSSVIKNIFAVSLSYTKISWISFTVIPVGVMSFAEISDVSIFLKLTPVILSTTTIFLADGSVMKISSASLNAREWGSSVICETSCFVILPPSPFATIILSFSGVQSPITTCLFSSKTSRTSSAPACKLGR